MKALVVDDDRVLADVLAFTLRREGFQVLLAYDGLAALQRWQDDQPDIIVLDINLPGLDGFEVCNRIREQADVPIILLTVRDEEDDVVRGLNMGADDYITKPFSPKELTARVRVVFRRMEQYSQSNTEIIRAADLTLDVTCMQVRATGRETPEFTPTEFELLATLAQHPGRVFTRAQLLDAVHGIAFESYERAIDAHIKNIRRKIEPNPHQPRYILTVYGVGYKFADR